MTLAYLKEKKVDEIQDIIVQKCSFLKYISQVWIYKRKENCVQNKVNQFGLVEFGLVGDYEYQFHLSHESWLSDFGAATVSQPNSSHSVAVWGKQDLD